MKIIFYTLILMISLIGVSYGDVVPDAISSLKVFGDLSGKGPMDVELKKHLIEKMDVKFDPKGDSEISVNPIYNYAAQSADLTIRITKSFTEDDPQVLKLNLKCKYIVKPYGFDKACLKNLATLINGNFKNIGPAPRKSLAETSMPKFYLKRDAPVVKVALIYYGDYYQETDLDRVQALLEKRFHLATDKALSIETVVKRIIPFKHQIVNFPEYRQDYVTDLARLQRLWYYDNVGEKIINEVYDQAKEGMEKIDFMLIVTGAQFDALGFASGRVAITENPMDSAWTFKDGGTTDYVTDGRVVDELIHEMGHTMFLGHASDQCFQEGLSIAETNRCCQESPSKNDVMSYCRNRNQVDEKIFFGFGECNLRNIRNKIIPAMLRGGLWESKMEVCL